METIGQQKLWTFIGLEPEARPTTNRQIRSGQASRVKSFLDLATKIAELQFRNRDYVLVFRGQSEDFRDIAAETTLKPTIFRPNDGEEALPDRREIVQRFELLQTKERALVQRYNEEQLLAPDRLERQRILRWSILQHYEVCRTPLLDVTHSLRIAASFATLRAEAGGREDAFVFVLGVPNLSGAMTASAEAGLQIVRLSSVCPPIALRPHLQEGYLLGEYPEMLTADQKRLYDAHEIDFGRRLVAKFIFEVDKFWDRGTFSRVGKNALFPSVRHDPFRALAERVKAMPYQQ